MHRIEALSDGVFAIVMTLLVFDIKIPQIFEASVATELPHRLFEMWPKLLSYLFSFIILGIYWVAHHALFHYIKHSDRNLLWLNILFLMSVVFIPFSTGLIGEYPRQQIALVVYGGNLILIGLVLYLLWIYATRGRRLVDVDIDPQVVRLAKRRILTSPVISFFAIGLSFFSTGWSIFLYALIPLLYIFPGRIDRHWGRATGQPLAETKAPNGGEQAPHYKN